MADLGPAPQRRATDAAVLAVARLDWVDRWQHENTQDWQARLVAFGYTGVEQSHMHSHAHANGSEPTSPRSDTSMGPILFHPSRTSHILSSRGSTAPSLTTTHSAPSASSIRTSAVSLKPPPLVENYVTNVLERPPGTPLYPCTFHFLGCTFTDSCPRIWGTHNLSHFHPHTPPTLAPCPLCPWKCEHSNGWAAWETWLDHVAEHIEAEDDVRCGKIDSGVLRFLWSKKIISDQHYKVLTGNAGATGNFAEFNGRGPRFEVGRSRESEVERERRRRRERRRGG